MRTSSFRIFLLSLCIAAFSCNELKVNERAGVSAFFNLPVFIREQTDTLKKLDVTVSKTTWINNKAEEVFFRADTGFWKREFDILSSIDISQPAVRDRYEMKQSDSSGYSITTYEAVDPDVNGVSYMRITRNTSSEILDIDIRQKEKNLLYHNRRDLKLKFLDSRGKFPGLLKEYNISGAQKIILRKEVAYDIKTTLDFRN